MRDLFKDGFKAEDFFTAGPYANKPVNAMLNPAMAALLANEMLSEALAEARQVYKDDSGESCNVWDQRSFDGDTHTALLICIKPLESGK